MDIQLAWLVPLFPLVAFLLLIAFRGVLGKGLASGISIVAMLASFAMACGFIWNSFVQLKTFDVLSYEWFSIAGKKIMLGMQLEPLNIMMIFLVTLVSLLVQIYSIGYMKEDQRFQTFFAYLSLFSFSMLGLVMSSNLLQIYFFWELVGVCSFLLVGFWYFKPEAKKAAKKAFIVTRIGDIGLFLAILMIYTKTGSFDVLTLKESVASGALAGTLLTTIAILIFVGAMGKSGQVPLHTWLPDAMEGPTPVSALIHAATMVAAGVYLVANLFFLYDASEIARLVVAYVGGITSLFAALIAITQTDIKRVLAYSTVSQLGLMMLALGSSDPYAGSFHLLTHGFFKALLFLSAGAVIVYLHHEQDLRKMGGLWKKAKWLAICFLVGCLSIAGIPPFSGFFSKDQVLHAVYLSDRIDLYVIGMITTFLTAFYMFRLFYLVFAKESRGAKVHTPVSLGMKLSIGVLTVLSILGGWIKIPSTVSQNSITHLVPQAHAPVWLIGSAVGVSLLGILLATILYVWKQGSADRLAKSVSWLYQISYRKFWIDELYQIMFVTSLKAFGWFLNGWDRFVVGGMVRAVGWGTMAIGRVGSRLQSGQVQTYALVSLIGFVVLLLSLAVGRLFE